MIGQDAKPSTAPESVGWQKTSADARPPAPRLPGVQSFTQIADGELRSHGGRDVHGTDDNVRVHPPVAVAAHWPFSWHNRPMIPVQPGAQYEPCTNVPAATDDGHTAL